MRVERSHIRTEWLDGDIVRLALSPDLGYSEKDREENVKRISWVTSLLVRQGITVLISVVSPFRASREFARAQMGSRFLEVFVNAPLEVCESRDPKGLYRKARLGQIEKFTGLSDVYERPLAPDLECRTDLETPAESAEKVMRLLSTRRLALKFLTLREQEVLALVGRGLTSKEIALELNVSTDTIANHRKHICKKLDLHSTAELVHRATEDLSLS